MLEIAIEKRASMASPVEKADYSRIHVGGLAVASENGRCLRVHTSRQTPAHCVSTIRVSPR